MLAHYGEEVVKRRVHAGGSGKRGLLAFAFLALTTLLSAFAAYGSGNAAGASASSRAASLVSSHDGETVAVREGRGGEIVSLRRAPKTADGSGNDRLGAVAWTPPTLTGIAPRAWVSALGQPRVAWITPSRARAVLMVFLN